MLNTLSNDKRKAPEALINLAQQKINRILSDVSGVSYVMLCSTDGFELASVHKKNIPNSSKLAAVSSSILAMISAFMGEVELSGCESITLDAEDGKAFLTAVPSKKYPLIIVTIADKNVLLGQLLHEIKRAANEISSASEKL